MKIGDLVILKSGGQKMRVKNIVGITTKFTETFIYKTSGYTVGDLVCQWFNENNKVELIVFYKNMLESCEEDN